MVNLPQGVDKILSDMKNEDHSLHKIKQLQKLKFSIIIEGKEGVWSDYRKALRKTKSYFHQLEETLQDEEKFVDFLKKNRYTLEVDENLFKKVEFYVQSLIKLNDQQEELFSKNNFEELRKAIVREIQYTDYLLHVLDYYNGNLSKRLKILHKKVLVGSIPTAMSLSECYEIYRGIKPLFFYHGTKLEQFKFILKNKQLSPKKHFDKKFNEEMKFYNTVKSLFVFIKEIEDILSGEINVNKTMLVINDLKKNRFLKMDKKILENIRKGNNQKIIKEKLRLLLEELNKRKIELMGKEADFYSVFKIRDPHFVFFGAEYPYACQENFQSCTNYAGVNGAVIEFYPKLYDRLDLDLMRPNSKKVLDLAVGTYREHAQVHGFLGHDLATRKKINVKFIRRIYTNNIREFQEAIANSELNIKLYPLSHQNKYFLEVMSEIEAILKKNDLIP